LKEIGITHRDIAAYLRSLTAGQYYGPRAQWPTYLPYRPEERLFFNAYTSEQVQAFVEANPKRWMANPYVGASPEVSLETELERLAATERPRLDGTRYFYRDDGELEDERETFEALTPR
jgi:hypothetical protein